jgi:hypothetical protein
LGAGATQGKEHGPAKRTHKTRERQHQQKSGQKRKLLRWKNRADLRIGIGNGSLNVFPVLLQSTCLRKSPGFFWNHGG